jgi:RimJ/RimL family protein N-acetyltransferase
MNAAPALKGKYIRLEPMCLEDVQALASVATDAELYKWSPVPQTLAEAEQYVRTALTWQREGTALPFTVVRLRDNTVVGSSRFFLIERWTWPPGHPRNARQYPDAAEIGYTWYAPSAVRTAANTESKLLMLTYAFETWGALRICFHTDARNTRSRNALERIGAKFEGVLRAHRIAPDGIPRDSYRFSILDSEWPEVKKQLIAKLNR